MYGAIRMGNAVTPVMKKLSQEALYAAHGIKVITGWIENLSGVASKVYAFGTGGVHLPSWLERLDSGHPLALPPPNDPLLKPCARKSKREFPSMSRFVKSG